MVKRLLDIVLSAAGLVVLSPFALLCVIAIKADDMHGSVLFRQERNGKDGEVFKMAKFRTMKRQLCGVNLEPTADTLTLPGKVMRKLSLDEIPQLFHILSGKMSLIGPRPLPLNYYEWFSEAERARFNVRPGITGLSQINGGADLNWDERFATDIRYVENLSFALDLKIFLRTFLVVFTRRDVIPDQNDNIGNFDDYRRKQHYKELLAQDAKLPQKAPASAQKAKSADKTKRVQP